MLEFKDNAESKVSRKKGLYVMSAEKGEYPNRADYKKFIAEEGKQNRSTGLLVKSNCYDVLLNPQSERVFGKTETNKDREPSL